MSLLQTFIRARKRQPEPPPLPESAEAPHGVEDDENIFNLLPPEHPDTPADVEEPVASLPTPPPPEPVGRNRQSVDMTDLSRLSIDTEGRLYWDGKPVETHHRLSMSPRQIMGASIIAACVAIGALGAVLQGSAAARDWVCWLGWSTSACALPGASPQAGTHIPI